jgi:hypothetical protein
MIGQDNAVYFVNFQSSLRILGTQSLHIATPLSMNRAYLSALNTLDNKRKVRQASDPSNIVPCWSNFSILQSLEKRHMTYSTRPGLDIRQSPYFSKRVSFCYRCPRDERRTCATPLLSPSTFPFTAGPSQSPLVR